MEYTITECTNLLSAVPEQAFAGFSKGASAEWLLFVTQVDEEPKKTHTLQFFAEVARMMAREVGSVSPRDFAVDYIKGVISKIALQSKPFDIEGEPTAWRDFNVSPAHVSVALRVIKMAQDNEQPSATLPYKKKARMTEVGLEALAESLVPTKESLLQLEALAKSAREQNQKFIGSSEGEDLMAHFRPLWTRTRSIDVLSGSGSLEGAQKDRSLHAKVDYSTYATFTGHILDWGVKMIITKSLSVVDLLSYQGVLAHIAEQHERVRLAYYYDMMLRQHVAKVLKSGDVEISNYFRTIDTDLLRLAKDQVQARAKEYYGWP